VKDLNELKQAIQKYPHRNIPKHELLEQLDGLVTNAKTYDDLHFLMIQAKCQWKDVGLEKKLREIKWVAVGSEEDKK